MAQFRSQRLSTPGRDPKKPRERRDQRYLKNSRFSFDFGNG